MSKNVSPTGTTGKTSRIDLYLQSDRLKPYCNTDAENERVNAFVTLYAMAKSARDATEECNPANLEKWRKAYNGTLNALKRQTVPRAIAERGNCARCVTS